MDYHEIQSHLVNEFYPRVIWNIPTCGTITDYMGYKWIIKSPTKWDAHPRMSYTYIFVLIPWYIHGEDFLVLVTIRTMVHKWNIIHID